MTDTPLSPEQARELARELAPLRAVVDTALTGTPFTLTAFGLADLTDRVTLAVAAYTGRTAGPQDPLCPDLNAHPGHVWSQDGILHQCLGRTGANPGDDRCHGCGEPFRFTGNGKACTHLASCTAVNRKPIERACRMRGKRHDAHTWGDGYRCPGAAGKGKHSG